MLYSVLQLGKSFCAGKLPLPLLRLHLPPTLPWPDGKRPMLSAIQHKSNVRNDFRDFRTGDAVLLGSLQVISQRAVGNPLTDK